jgi:hypothetical protein
VRAAPTYLPLALALRDQALPWRRAFWCGEVDAGPIALFRAALGLLVATDLLDRLRDFHGFYGVGSVAFGPAWEVVPDGVRLAALLVGVVLAVAFALGLAARLVTPLLWAFCVALGAANPWVSDGGDAVVRLLLLWSCVADLGAAASLDVRLGRRRARATVPAAGVRLLQLQVVLIYLVTFLAKHGGAWWDGSAVGRVLSLSDWARGLGPWLRASSGLCALLTYAVLIFEGGFVLLALAPWRTARRLAVLGGLALHAGIFLTLRVGLFSQVMPVALLTLLAAPGGGTGGEPKGAALVRAPRPLEGRAAWALILLAAAVGLTDLGLGAAGIPVGRRAVDALGLGQRWTMFAPNIPRTSVVWSAPALVEGDATAGSFDLLTAVAPGLLPHVGFRYSRWHRLRDHLGLADARLLAPLGAFLCRRHEAMRRSHEPRLLRFELRGTTSEVSFPPTTPASPARSSFVLLRQACR